MTTQIRKHVMGAMGLAAVGILCLCAVGAWKQYAGAQAGPVGVPEARAAVSADPRQLTAIDSRYAMPDVESVAFLGEMTVSATRLL